MRFKLKRLLIVITGMTLCGIIIVHFYDYSLTADGQEFVRKAKRFVVGSEVRDTRLSEPKKVSVWDAIPSDDRILSQINYVPKGLTDEDPMKVIYVNGGMGDFGAKLGEKEFHRQNCSVRNCFITTSQQRVKDADVVLYRELWEMEKIKSVPHPDQIWIYYALESPFAMPEYNGMRKVMNWTATYRRDSTLVTPYAKWVPFDPPQRSPSFDRNFAEGKSKQVAWFVSNCGANNNRLEYAKELGKYIDVDIIGLCGQNTCQRHDQDCWEKLNEDYKFYLSFENSNCRDYITEKFFANGLGYEVIPIVMGAHPDDYRKVAPPHSYIHVEDFDSPKSLAAYLNKLDSNNRLYNEYFHWKGTGRFINTKFWCRLCALLNDKEKPVRVVEDLEQWWDGDGICQRGPWMSKRKF